MRTLIRYASAVLMSGAGAIFIWEAGHTAFGKPITLSWNTVMLTGIILVSAAMLRITDN